METEIQKLGKRPAVREEVLQLRQCVAAPKHSWVWEKRMPQGKDVPGRKV